MKALDDGWEDVHRMWDNKQNLLSQSLNLQVFLRDAKQAEVMLSQQDNFLSKEEVPVSHTLFVSPVWLGIFVNNEPLFKKV